MKEVFKERLDNSIEFFILFSFLTFMWLLSDFPWVTIIVGVTFFLYFRTKIYYFVFTDSNLEIVYPFMPSKTFKVNCEDVETIHHMILYTGAFAYRRSDLIQVKIRTNIYKVAIQREPEAFRKINELIHNNSWSQKVKTKGDETNIQEVIKQRDDGWIK